MSFIKKVLCKRLMPFFMERVTENLKINRADILSPCEGHVLEVGIGTGANLPFYPDSVAKVSGLDIDENLLKRCQRKWDQIQGRKPELELIKGNIENLTFPSQRFDTAISCLVFCSVSDAAKGARELYRVLRPGGRVVFFEHVLDWDDTTAKWQRRLNPLWSRLSCGCQMTRQTNRVFEEAGFQFQELESTYYKSLGRLFSAVIKGIALKP
ncbi:MAG: methyltransferase type 11 [Acidobacteria bacterium]|nr:MAG: methyltransferase type 11 [Acidobacteriota bacterium]PIE91077.1 MAG: methyltransferase type 11 [Acidobacteriota bacterium]